MRRMPLNAVGRFPAVLAAAVFAAACFSDAPTEPAGNQDVDFDLSCANDQQPPDGSAQVVVRIRNFAFEPANVTIDAGTEVVWLNCEGSGGAAHTTTSDDDLWDSGLLDPDEGRYARVFDDAGVFAYHCTPHPFMQGDVVVKNPL